MGLDGFEWVLPSFTEFLLGLMGGSGVSLGFTEFDRVQLGFNEYN